MRNFCFSLMRCATPKTGSKYEKKTRDALYQICECNNILECLQWWTCRRYYSVPFFCSFGISQLNLAEPEQSSMMTKVRLKQSVVAWYDIYHKIIQDEDYRISLKIEVNQLAEA